MKCKRGYRGRKSKILIIHDVPSIRTALERWLAQMGYQYTFVDSADEAREVLAHENFDATVYSHEFFFPPSRCPE